MFLKQSRNRDTSALFVVVMILTLLITQCKKEDPYEEYKNMSPDVWAPQSLTIADVSITEKTLVWIYQLTNIEGFRLDRKIGDGAWQIGYRQLPKELRTWNDNDVKPDISVTYNYRLYAYAGDYYSGAEETSSPIVFPPPTMLTTEKISEKEYKISWVDMSNGEQGFKIDHRVDDGAWELGYDSVGANQTSFVDTNVFRSVDIHYRVYAYHEEYNSEKMSVNTNASLTPPTNLQIIKNSVSSVTLYWQDNSEGEEIFWILRKYDNGNWEHIASAKEDTYIDEDFEQVSSVSYRVCAHAGQYNSDYAQNSFNAQLLSPLGLQINRTSINSATLSWSDNNNGEEGFKIERKYEGGNWSFQNTTTDNSYIDNNFEIDKQVYYRIYSYYGDYNSAWAEIDFNSEVPSPTNLQLIQSSITSISLSWQFLVSGHDGFIVERKYESGNWEMLSTLTSNNFEDNSFEINNQVYYRVYAYFGDYYSGTTETYFNSMIPSPEILEVIVNSLTSATIYWDFNHIGHEGFKVDRKIDAGAWQNEFAIIGTNQNSYTDINIDLELHDYTYRLYAFVEAYNSQKNQYLLDDWCGISFTDGRDGNHYGTVKIGNQCWMSENLAYLPSVYPSYNSSTTIPYYYVYDYNGTSVSDAKETSNYQTYGTLYNWPAANIACPEGWHLPSDDEWKILEGSADSQYGVGNSVWDFSGWRGYDAGHNLKSTYDWSWDGNGIDLYGFTGLPAGKRHLNGFSFKGLWGIWYSSTVSGGYNSSWIRTMGYEQHKISRSEINQTRGLSIRCILNE